jgi:Transposase IS116/IS110/IS902 family
MPQRHTRSGSEGSARSCCGPSSPRKRKDDQVEAGQDRGLPTLRLPARVLHGISRDSGETPNATLSAPPGPMVQIKNRVSGLLMETGVTHNGQRLHKVGYFNDLLASNDAITESLRPLLQLSKDSITRLHRIEAAIIRSLERDSLLAERVRRLRTIPGVGPIRALTWALEMGDISRFRSIRQAISYCGLCGDEKRSADKMVRTSLSRQRNKHIQRVLVEAAKLAPRRNPDLALVYETEKKRGNANRATLVVARKMAAYLLAIDREQRDFVPLPGLSGVAV